jgi:hypothetical protein
MPTHAKKELQDKTIQKDGWGIYFRVCDDEKNRSIAFLRQ